MKNMRNLISYYWDLLTGINERGIYRRDEFDINLLNGKKNSEYLLISRQSARLTFLSAIAFFVSTLAVVISTYALIIASNSNSDKTSEHTQRECYQRIIKYR